MLVVDCPGNSYVNQLASQFFFGDFLDGEQVLDVFFSGMGSVKHRLDDFNGEFTLFGDSGLVFWFDPFKIFACEEATCQRAPGDKSVVILLVKR